MLGQVASQLLGGVLLSVVIPTISGRKESLARAIASYRQTLDGEPHEIIVVEDEPSWPGACNLGFEQSKGDVIHFSADDLEALPDWNTQAVAHCVVHNELPAPVVYNHSPDGPWDNFMDGGDGQLTHFTRIPLMTRRQYELIGPWPEDLDYCADVWVSERGRTIGILTRMIHSYRFVHHWSQIGRIDTPEVVAGANARLLEYRAEGFPRCESTS